MKVINLKWILIICGFVWVSLSFFWFTSSLTKTKAEKTAVHLVERAESELLKTSSDLKFKLGQWAYNYQLVKTQGLDFDQDAFLESEFEDIYFFKLSKGNLQAQWVKSKDMATAAIPKALKIKLKQWPTDNILDKKFIYFSEKASSNLSKVFFGFPVKDETMGEGLILSALDLDYVQLISPNINTYLLDAKGRYIFHPQKEYIGQNALNLTHTKLKNTLIKAMAINSLGLDMVYKAKVESTWSQILGPNLVMSLGLLLIFGVLLFDFYIKAPLNLNSSLDISAAKDIDIDLPNNDTQATKKLEDIHEALNKMSMLSSSLKGRIDLGSREQIDSQLFESIKNDFENLDNTIDKAYKSTRSFESSNISFKTKTTAENEAELSLNNDVDLVDLNLEDLDLEGLNLDLAESKDSSLSSFAIDDIESLDTTESEDGVVFQEYFGTDSEPSDWAKIIDELTEEINTAELKPTQSSKDI